MRKAVLMVMVLSLSSAPPAGADGGPKIDSGWYLPVGINLGAAIHTTLPNGFFLGAEASLAYLNMEFGLWAGGYMDGLYDFGPHAFRFSVGPEVGWAVLGLDMGYLGELRDGELNHGIQLRLLLTLSVIALYGRWGHLFGSLDENDFGEIGLLLKFPIAVATEPRHRPR